MLLLIRLAETISFGIYSSVGSHVTVISSPVAYIGPCQLHARLEDKSINLYGTKRLRCAGDAACPRESVCDNCVAMPITSCHRYEKCPLFQRQFSSLFPMLIRKRQAVLRHSRCVQSRKFRRREFFLSHNASLSRCIYCLRELSPLTSATVHDDFMIYF